GTHIDGQWFLTFRSVIVFGKMELIEDPEIIRDLSRKLSYKFTKDEEYIEYELEHSGPRTLMYALTIENMCGKRVNER
ncbi:MAG TPA: 5-nitroimidazole antibiotic resistance protein, partial [Erysipelotrichaceae bacterium]|nr:5-nitroimidazole antibiotic resistance protein [Erysipelotrichaceae bacterium]